jgi:hypothetical protein
MMTKGMKDAPKKREVQDKDTNINCSKCGETVGVIAAGYTLALREVAGAERQNSLCKCGNRMVFYVTKG